MTKRNYFQEIIIYVVMALFMAFTYIMMNSLELAQDSVGSNPGIISMVLFLLSIITQLFSRNKHQTYFLRVWIIWSIWLFIDINVFGLTSGGYSNYFRTVFCPMTFILFYYASLSSDKTEKIAFGGFLLIYVLAYYLNIKNISKYSMLVAGEDTAISNLVYWCLTVVPVLICNKKRWFQMAIIITMLFCVVITGKRSAFISMALIIVVYFLISNKERKKKLSNTVIIILGSLVAFYVISRYASGSFYGVLDRLNSINDDEGSGRVVLYNDVFDTMGNFNFLDWLLGKGYGSILLSRHTNAHNDALQMLFEYGIIGLVFYVFMLVYALKRLRILKRIKSEYYLGYAISMIIFIVLGLVSNLVVFYSYFAFICAFWGIVEAKLVQKNYL